MARDPLAARRQVGYLPEQVKLYPGPHGAAIPRASSPSVKGLGRGAQRAAVDDVIARCNLGGRRRPPDGEALARATASASGLAQALVGDPPVLVLDEPTVGLDPVQTVEMRALIAALRGRSAPSCSRRTSSPRRARSARAS